MASSASNPNPTFHTRSISLPSRPNPLIANIDEQARKLASSSEPSTPSTSSSVRSRLSDLRDLYDSVDSLLELPTTQQQLSHDNHKDLVDGLLSSSMYFLDVCGIAKDALLQTNEQAQDLQSVLRRKRGYESELLKESSKYLALRKNSKKSISKSLRGLKTNNLSESHSNMNAIFGTLRQVEVATAAVFEILLSFLSGPNAQSKGSRWSLISKLKASSKRVSSCKESIESSEFEDLDSILQALIRSKSGKNVILGKEEGLQNGLRRLESSTQDLEEELESMLRCIIKTRASLLNVLTN